MIEVPILYQIAKEKATHSRQVAFLCQISPDLLCRYVPALATLVAVNVTVWSVKI